MRRTLLALLLASLALLPLGAQVPVPATAPLALGAATPPAEPPAHAATEPGGHTNPVAPVLLALLVILVGAKLGGRAAERLRQPAVLGELVAGVLLGNLALLGWTGLEFLAADQGVRILAELGVILLLFEVGLESRVSEMLSVGWSSLLVACLGVVAPFFLGWGAAAWLLPNEPTLVHVFIGATLCATSVGITARVFTDLGKLQARESRIVLGAAVIDDVLGLVILAVVTGTIRAADRGGELDAWSVLWIIAKAALFLVGALALGPWVSRRLFGFATRLQLRGMLLVGSLAFCFLLALVANLVELAPIVGAFAAGLVLEELHYANLPDRTEHDLEELLRPIAALLVPIFFVRMGLAVDLQSFGSPTVLGLAALLTLAAVAGKMACAGGVLERGLDRLSVAVGMVPRGEVGLIFAGMGAQMTLYGRQLVGPAIYSALVIMVIATTVVTPPLLAASLRRGDRRRAGVAAPPAQPVAGA